MAPGKKYYMDRKKVVPAIFEINIHTKICSLCI
jgi:hypothetical protein